MMFDVALNASVSLNRISHFPLIALALISMARWTQNLPLFDTWSLAHLLRACGGGRETTDFCPGGFRSAMVISTQTSPLGTIRLRAACG
jgi:hypothetical protein